MIMVIISSSITKIPADYKDFFIGSENKLQLAKFLCENALKFPLDIWKAVYICSQFQDPEKCFKLQCSSFIEVADLKYHLEADSRMFNHIFHFAKFLNYEIVFLSPDTDVSFLGIYF